MLWILWKNIYLCCIGVEAEISEKDVLKLSWKVSATSGDRESLFVKEQIIAFHSSHFVVGMCYAYYTMLMCFFFFVFFHSMS